MTQVIIEKELKGTPMEGHAEDFIAAGIKYSVDPLFLVAIGNHESHYGSAYPKSANDERHNYAGVMTYDNGIRRLRRYKTWTEAIFDHARNIRENYLDKGKTTIKQIWYTYAPPLEITNDSWGPAVANKYKQLVLAFQ